MTVFANSASLSNIWRSDAQVTPSICEGISTQPSRVSRSRRIKDQAFTAFMGLCVVFALVPLVLIVGYVMIKGWSALSVNLFTKTPASPLHAAQGGIVQAFYGTALIVGMAVLFSYLH